MMCAWGAGTRGRTPHVRRTHHVAQLLEFLEHELDALELVRSPPVVGHARRRQAPRIVYVRIKVDGLVGVWQVLGLRVDRGITREVFGEEVAIRRAPSRDTGWRVHTDGGA